jgi:hypothetical protein
MTTEQPLALVLADELDAIPDTGADPDMLNEAAAELRRLHQSEREGWRYADELEQDRKKLQAENEALRERLK